MKNCWKNKFRSYLSFFSFLLLGIISITSCDDEPNDLGLSLLPGEDKIPAYYIDTVTIGLSQYILPINYYTTGNNPLIGVADDPVFGRIWAGVASDLFFKDGYDSAYFDKKKVLDSVKIVFQFDSIFYFNSANPFDHNLLIEIYNLTKPIYRDSAYKTDIKPESFLPGTKLLFSQEVNILWKNVSFKMPSSSHSFFQKYLDLDSNKVQNESDRYNKGLYGLFFYPVHQNGRNILARLQTANYENCYLRMYYHLENTETVDSLTAFFYSYYVDSTNNTKYGNAGLSFMTYNYNRAAIKTRLNGSTNDSLIYILSENNLRAKIDFSNLMKLPDIGHYNVLKSEILIPYEPTFYNSSSAIQTKTGLIKSIELKVALKTDSFVSYTNQFSSPLYSAYIDTANKHYVIDVTNYIYKRLNNKTSVNELYVFPYYQYNVNTTMLKNKLKLKIKYLKY